MNTSPRRRSRSPSRSSAGLRLIARRRLVITVISTSADRQRHETGAGPRACAEATALDGKRRCMEERRFGRYCVGDVRREHQHHWKTVDSLKRSRRGHLRRSSSPGRRVKEPTDPFSGASTSTTGKMGSASGSKKRFWNFGKTSMSRRRDRDDREPGLLRHGSPHAARPAAWRQRSTTGRSPGTRTTARSQGVRFLDQGRGPRSCRASGVGDVGGERGDRSPDLSRRSARDAERSGALRRRNRVGLDRVPGLSGQGGLFRGTEGMRAWSREWSEGLEFTVEAEVLTVMTTWSRSRTGAAADERGGGRGQLCV